MLSLANCRRLLNVCKPFFKINYICKSHKISQPTISKFINYNNTEFISDKKANELVDEIYSCCLLYVDIYNEIKKKSDNIHYAK